MNTTLFHRRRAQRFAQLLDEANGGRRHHVRTRLDQQLTELVAIGHQISARPPTVEVDPGFRADTRAMLLATAQREGIGRTAEAAAAAAEAPPRWSPAARRGTRRAATGYPGRLRTRGAVVVGIAAGAIAISGMSAASEGAVPGDPLYGVKRSAERAQLALASSDVTKGQLYLDFARTRLAEAAAVHADPEGYVNVLDDMDADTRHGVKLLHVAAMVRRDPAALDAVEAFRTGQRQGLGDLLDLTTGVTRTRTLKSLELLE
ncbi:MAG TPA: DUF5667 domain-containing protein, partial [Pilimelia sp.]|nr:DUF5667 domain-containing protein [Pilimelia sp.]